MEYEDELHLESDWGKQCLREDWVSKLQEFPMRTVTDSCGYPVEPLLSETVRYGLSVKVPGILVPILTRENMAYLFNRYP